MRGLGRKLIANTAQRRAQVLFSHLHVDHIFGFPFFLPLFAPGWDISVGVPAFSDAEAKERIARYLNGTFHPVRLRDIAANVRFHAVRAGRSIPSEGWQIDALRLHHPGGALGYRVSAPASGGEPAATIAYLTDTQPFAAPGEGVAANKPPTAAEQRLIAFLKGVDLCIFDTMFDYDDYLEKMHFGHSYPEYAIAICRAAGVPELQLFHHQPEADDAELDARAARYLGVEGVRVRLAQEGSTVTPGGGRVLA